MNSAARRGDEVKARAVSQGSRDRAAAFNHSAQSASRIGGSPTMRRK